MSYGYWIQIMFFVV